MPSTRSRAPASAPVIEDEEDEQEQGVSLQFAEPLTWRAGRAIPVSDLLRRLQTLSQELRDLDQEEAERASLLPVAKELASNNLIQHKDRGVRAWTACCLVDMFRLCAPDAPYSVSQLKDVFNLFVSTIFPALADPSSPYNGQHLYVLKSLAEVKTIVLVTDIPSSSDLIERLFTCCFDVLSGPSKATTGEELGKNVEHNMTAVLSILVDESQGLPGEVLDVVLAQFLRADPDTVGGVTSKSKKLNAVDDKQSTLVLKEAPAAYNMAKNICNACADKMARYLSQYFSSIIMDTAPTTEPSTNKPRSETRVNGTLGKSAEDLSRSLASGDFSESVKAHKLLRELWRSTPAILTDIVPQLEVELSAEEPTLRVLATETLGDMVSGIGASGPPPPPKLDPIAYPSQSLTDTIEGASAYNFLTTPTSPYSFPFRYQQVYESFISRRKDYSPSVRAAWVTGIGRIIMTSAGSVGLDPEEEQRLLRYLSEKLVDADERVRLAAIKAIEQFSFQDIVYKLGSCGGVADQGSVLANLADRVKDLKPNVHTDAMRLLARIWGVAYGAIAEGSERINALLGPIPSRIFDAWYINNPQISALIESVLHESLFPLGFPPIKPKHAQATNGASKKGKSSRNEEDVGSTDSDPDKIRAIRMLVLIKGLEPKSKTILFAKQALPEARYMGVFLKKCEEYNGGVIDKGEKAVKSQLGVMIDQLSKLLPEAWRASEDLWKFAKTHDRRNYQLIRFSMAPESDYRKTYKAMKELTKRLEDASSNMSTLRGTLMQLMYRVSILLYNRSHVPSIIEFSRTDENELGGTAHEVLKEISTHHPEIFKAHIKDLCQALESHAPTPEDPNSQGAVDNLKACAGFAKKFPKDVPKERKFIQSLVSFAVHGTAPKAAKYAVSIVMYCVDRKAMYVKDILRVCTKDFAYGSTNWISKLAAISQLVLLGSGELDDDDNDTVIDIAINHVLLTSHAIEQEEEVEWDDEPDEHCAAKIWALKILVNRLLSLDDEKSVQENATPVYQYLNSLIAKGGLLSSSDKSPKSHRSRLRLTAARLLLKLSCSKKFHALLAPKDFNQLATVAQDPLHRVRSGFIIQLMKYLGEDRLNRRFYVIVFLLAFEPEEKIKHRAVTWVRARAAAFAKAKDSTMEALLSRLLSLLAHHPDFDRDVDNLKDFVRYILFYLNAVATQDNLSLIFHVAQRVKTVQDGIDPSMSENLYCLSDLSQAVVHRFEEVKGWSMQAWPGRQKMPGGIFAPLPSHTVSQQIATTQYVSEELLEDLDDIVKDSLRTKKRKHDTGGDRTSKRRKPSTLGVSKPRWLPVRKSEKRPKTPRLRKDPEQDSVPPSSERRRSGRNATHKSYVESSSNEDEMDVHYSDDVDDEGDDVRGGSAEFARGDKDARKSTTGSTKVNGRLLASTTRNAQKRTRRKARGSSPQGGSDDSRSDAG